MTVGDLKQYLADIDDDSLEVVVSVRNEFGHGLDGFFHAGAKVITTVWVSDVGRYEEHGDGQIYRVLAVGRHYS